MARRPQLHVAEPRLWTPGRDGDDLDVFRRPARSLRRQGVYCHLLGTHIQPKRNWRFLETRMASGQAFGRYITKEQAFEGLVRYQENAEAILEDPELLGLFDSLHFYDVIRDRWCVSLQNERQQKGDDDPTLVG